MWKCSASGFLFLRDSLNIRGTRTNLSIVNTSGGRRTPPSHWVDSFGTTSWQSLVYGLDNHNTYSWMVELRNEHIHKPKGSNFHITARKQTELQPRHYSAVAVWHHHWCWCPTWTACSKSMRPAADAVADLVVFASKKKKLPVKQRMGRFSEAYDYDFEIRWSRGWQPKCSLKVCRCLTCQTHVLRHRIVSSDLQVDLVPSSKLWIWKFQTSTPGSDPQNPTDLCRILCTTQLYASKKVAILGCSDLVLPPRNREILCYGIWAEGKAWIVHHRCVVLNWKCYAVAKKQNLSNIKIDALDHAKDVHFYGNLLKLFIGMNLRHISQNSNCSDTVWC